MEPEKEWAVLQAVSYAQAGYQWATFGGIVKAAESHRKCRSLTLLGDDLFRRLDDCCERGLLEKRDHKGETLYRLTEEAFTIPGLEIMHF